MLREISNKNKVWFSELIEQFSGDEIFTQSAALAFYTVLSMAPLLILMVSFLATLELDLQAQLIEQVGGLIGHEAATVMQAVIEGIQSAPDLSSIRGWVGALALLLSSSIVFAHLQKTLNLIFDAGQRGDEEVVGKIANLRVLIVRRVLSFGMVLSFIFIAIVSLLVSSAISLFSSKDGVWWSWIASFSANFFIFSILFFIIFKWIPDRQVKTSTALLSGVLTTTLFIFGKELIGLYIGQTAVGSAYGAAGSLVVLLVWVYYSSLIFFLGAEIASVILIRNRREARTLAKAA